MALATMGLSVRFVTNDIFCGSLHRMAARFGRAEQRKLDDVAQNLSRGGSRRVSAHPRFGVR
jgi:hypothetical protein